MLNPHTFSGEPFFKFNYLLLKIYSSTLTNCIIIDSICIDIHFQKLHKYEFKYGTFHTVSSIGRGVGSILTECLKYFGDKLHQEETIESGLCGYKKRTSQVSP